jgi:hypothetical protein
MTSHLVSHSRLSSTTRVEDAFSLLFEGYQVRPRPETDWVERVLDSGNPSTGDIEAEIRVAIAMYCPNLPDDSASYLIGVLRSAVEAARKTEQKLNRARPRLCRPEEFEERLD